MITGLIFVLFYLLVAVLVFSYAMMLSTERGISSKTILENLIGALLWPVVLLLLAVQIVQRGWKNE